MRPQTHLPLSALLALSALSAPALHAAPAEAKASTFDFKDGDVVAFLGDGFAEREQYSAAMETMLTTAYPDRNLRFRNLGWSGDTPAGISRCGLSLLQAGTEPADEGWRQLQNQLTTFKPNVLITGYGMASALPGGQSADDFRKDFERLMDHAASIPGMRVMVLGAPPRMLRPGETDDTPLVRQTRESLAAINRVLEDIATRRSLPFVAMDSLDKPGSQQDIYPDGIHYSAQAYGEVGRLILRRCGMEPKPMQRSAAFDALVDAIIRKNEWFFHRSRPANMAYIFGFRKGEQGRNAGEVEAFDKEVAAEENRIAQMRNPAKGYVVPTPPKRTESKVATNADQPTPSFTVADGYEVTLWAENPMLHKPTQMNFDAAGRLWVASSETYPQVEVGQTADDKILILEDTRGTGKADSSKVFTTGLLMPTSVMPVPGGCYVAQATDLLYFPDKNGDLKADGRQRILSGFGTEDTHHDLHTIQRGPDGKLWMNQSIYTRSDAETPNGVMRLKSGGIMRFDPVADKIEPIYYGWCNPWGHQFDNYGQSFVTDGAGGGGINWAVPGAMYFTYAGAEKTLDSISPGSYPKFCGLEIVESPLFPDWQGSMITCDFRAHRVVRFTVTESGSGYAAQEAGDVLRSTSESFRPIDVKMGPDGALYIADWANPIINHGEVDFRDPRRDREHGRIWRVQKKGAKLLPRRDLAKANTPVLLGLLASDNRYEREQATALLVDRPPTPQMDAEISKWAQTATSGRPLLAALWLAEGRGKPDAALLEKALADPDGRVRAAAVRVAGDWNEVLGADKALSLLEKSSTDEHPRVRVEAVRALAHLGTPAAMDAALRAISKPTDRFLDYALWLDAKELGEAWLSALMDGKLSMEGKDQALTYVLGNMPGGKGIDSIRKLMPNPVPRDGSGPWIGLALKTGDATMLNAVYEQALDGGFDAPAAAKVLRGVEDLANAGKNKPAGDPGKLAGLFHSESPELAAAAMRAAGALQAENLLGTLKSIATEASAAIPVRLAAVEGLSRYTSPAGQQALESLAGGDLGAPAALALARHHRPEAIAAMRPVLAGLKDTEKARAFWQQALSLSGLSGDLMKALKDQPLPADAAAASLAAVPDIDENAPLLAALRQQAGTAVQAGPDAKLIAALAKEAAEKGDAAHGELVYRRAAISCTACHAIGGAGGRVGPDLTSIGASAPLDYLVESVLLPAAKVKEGYHSVIFETKDGRTLMGRVLRSGGGNVVIADAAGQELTLAEDNIAKKTDAGTLMPAGLIDALPPQEKLDLFKFLSQLGRPGDFDATKSRSPRVWALLSAGKADATAALAGEASLPWVPVTSTVNGTLLATDIVAMTGGATEIYAATKIELAEAATLSLSFPASPPEDGDFAIDGKAVPPDGKVELTAGVHKIVLHCRTGGEDVRYDASSGTFLPVW